MRSAAFGHPAQHSRRRIRPRVARFAPGARTRPRRRDAPSGGPRLRREAQGVSAVPGCPSLWLLSLGQARESNPRPRGERHHCGLGIAAGDTPLTLPSPGGRGNKTAVRERALHSQKQLRPSPQPLGNRSRRCSTSCIHAVVSRRERGKMTVRVTHPTLPIKPSPRVPTPPACQTIRAHHRRSTWYSAPAPAR
jgi:hypothetical protein